MKTQTKRVQNHILPDLEPLWLSESDFDRAAYSFEQWGTTAFEYVLGAQHCRVEAIRAPEGLVAVLRCDACGGRCEVLLPGPGNGIPTDSDYKRSMDGLQLAMAASTRFQAQHTDCRACSVPTRITTIVVMVSLRL